MKPILADDPRWVLDDLFVDDAPVTEQVAERLATSDSVAPSSAPAELPEAPLPLPAAAPQAARPLDDLFVESPYRDVSRLDETALEELFEDESPEDYFKARRAKAYEWMDVSQPDEWFASDEETTQAAIKHWAGGSSWMGLRALLNGAGITTSDAEQLKSSIEEYHTLPDKYKYTRAGINYLKELEMRYKNITDPEDEEFTTLVGNTVDAIIESPAEVGQGIAKAIIADPLFFAAFLVPVLSVNKLNTFAKYMASLGEQGVKAQRIVKTSSKIGAIAAQEAAIGAMYQYGVNKARGAPDFHDIENMAGLSAAAGTLLFGAGASMRWLKRGGKFEDQIANLESLRKTLDNESKWVGAEVSDVIVNFKKHIDSGLDSESAIDATRKDMDLKFGDSETQKKKDRGDVTVQKDEDSPGQKIFTMDEPGLEALLKAKEGTIFQAPDFMPGWKIEVGPTLGRAGDIIGYDRNRKMLQVDVQRAMKDFFEARRKFTSPTRKSSFGKAFNEALDRMKVDREMLADHLTDPTKFTRFILEKEKAYATRPRAKTASLKKHATKAPTSEVRHLRNVQRHMKAMDHAIKATKYKQPNLETKAVRAFNLKKELGAAQTRAKVREIKGTAQRAAPFVATTARRAVQRGREAFNINRGRFPETPDEIRIDKEGVARTYTPPPRSKVGEAVRPTRPSAGPSVRPSAGPSVRPSAGPTMKPSARSTRKPESEFIPEGKPIKARPLDDLFRDQVEAEIPETTIDYRDTVRRAADAVKAGARSAIRDVGRAPGIGGTKGKAYKRAVDRNYRDILTREQRASKEKQTPITKEQKAAFRKEAHRRAREEQPDVVGKIYRTGARVFKAYKNFQGAIQGIRTFLRDPARLLEEARKTARYTLGHEEAGRFTDYVKEHMGMIGVMERHIRGAVEQITDKLPNSEVRRAVSHYIEGNLDEYNALRISRGEAPITLTKEELAAVKQIRGVLDEVYKWIRKQPGGHNVKKRKNYIPHLYQHQFNTSFEDYLSQLLGAPKKALATRSTHYYAREFDTLMDAMEAGYMPIEDIGELLSGYLRGIFRVEANKMLINRIRNLTDGEDIPMVIRRDDAPEHYVPIKHASFRDKNGDYLYAHSDIAPTLKMVFDTRNPGTLQRLLLNLTYLVKRSVLAFSMFHGVALLESALYAGMNPMQMRKEFKTALQQLKEGDLGDVIDLGMMNGLQIGWIDDIKGDALYNAMGAAQGLLEQIPYFGKTAAQLPKGVRVFHENLDKVLWDKIATGGKIIAFTKNLDKLIRTNAKMAEQGKVPLRDINELAAEAAMFTNDAFGGLNWNRMAMNVKNNMMHRVGSAMASHSGRRAMQMLIFAPDWSLANIRIQAKAFPGMNSKKDVRRLYQYYMARGAVMFALFAEAIQQASGEGSVFDNPFPLGWMRPKLGEGMRIEWSKQLAEVPREIYYVMKGDPLHSLYWKSAFLPRAISDLSKGQPVKEAVLDKVVPITLSNLAKPPHWQAVAGALSKPIYVRD